MALFQAGHILTLYEKGEVYLSLFFTKSVQHPNLVRKGGVLYLSLFRTKERETS